MVFGYRGEARICYNRSISISKFYSIFSQNITSYMNVQISCIFPHFFFFLLKWTNPPFPPCQYWSSKRILRSTCCAKCPKATSPISVAIALSMVYAGAKDRTAKEMGQVLAKGAPESKVHEYFGQLLKTMNDGEKSYTLKVANKVYVKSGFDILDTFKTAINDYYGGQFESVDFQQNVYTAKKINKFVERATHDKIHDLIQPGMLDALTRLVLVNAIYFKGNWANKFKAEATMKEPFYMSEGNSKELDLMHKTASFIYHRDGQLQLLGMPYVGEDMFMFLVLPKKRFGLDEVLANMTGASLLELVQKRHKQKVDLTLPKFKLESTHDLNEPLKNLGMPEAFNDSANFSGITQEEPLQISQLIQKAFIELNEEGTEAAACVCCPCCCCASLVIEPPPPVFRADQPFLMALVSANGQILFNGIFRG